MSATLNPLCHVDAKDDCSPEVTSATIERNDNPPPEVIDDVLDNTPCILFHALTEQVVSFMMKLAGSINE